ncbi:MAG: SusC/RagA family TonB-linked outer membrane protein [Marinifilaceae bacterium]
MTFKNKTVRCICARILLSCLFSVASIGTLSAKTTAVQNNTEQPTSNMISMVELFEYLQEHSQLKFVFNHQNVETYKVSEEIKNGAVEDVLKIALADKPLQYKITSEHVIISPATRMAQQQEKMKKITGVVLDNTKQSLPGVTVVVQGTSIGTATDIDGKFELLVPTGDSTKLVCTFIGMETQIIPLKNNINNYNIVLHSASTELDDVVITGYFDRSKKSLTGSQVQVEGEELRKIGSLNMIQAISLFDPSVRTIPNNEFGSDPNRVPEISIRGENGFDLRGEADDAKSNPNAPLYIMDGIEVSPTAVYDMDMNRIESFVILKDASATSLYGSRAANGVILITTVAPKEGEIRLTFNTNFNFSIPDLRDYNLMNAAEKLEYELLAGEFKSKTSQKEEQMKLDILYNDRLSEVLRGVDTYWLSQPLRTSVNQRYNLFIEGGDKSFRYGIDLRYDKDNGVMKKSGRDKMGININFNYQIAEKLYIRNDLMVNDVKGINSPYGSFEEYALQNPYERITDPKTGEKTRRFESNNKVNPMLDADYPNRDYNKYTEIKDNIQLDWRPNRHTRLKGQMSIAKKTLRDERYLSARSSVFDKEEDPNKKGSYTLSNSSSLNYDGNITASYNNMFAEKISFNLGIGSNITASKLDGEGFSLLGFLNDNMDSPEFAQKFDEDKMVTGKYDDNRLIGFFGNTNIGYDNRYFIDASFRTDGSSRFGRNSRFAPFWSVGFAWNVNQEDFWHGDGSLKIRASVGSTGSVNFNADQAMTTLYYGPDYEYNGIYGANLTTFGNPGLKWQNTLQYNAGIDLNIWRNIITFNVDAYLKQTQNLLLPIDVAPSTGFYSYTENMGSINNTGIDARLRLNLINNKHKQLDWSVTLAASHNKNVIKNLSNALEAMNEEAFKLDNSAGAKPLRVYEEGRSQSALMVVKSHGIDPATGNEIYEKLNGDLTYDYDARDKIIVGDLNPKIQGNIQSNLNWRGFNLFLAFNYEYGAKIYNSTLAKKVEGASPKNNADKRVLYDRWKKPGDKAMFRRIDDQTDVYQSTRLVQDDNFLNFQSLSFSYDIPRSTLDKVFIERCRIQFTMGDIVRISTVKQERGTSYPFARTFSLGLNLTI